MWLLATENWESAEHHEERWAFSIQGQEENLYKDNQISFWRKSFVYF